MRLGITGDSHSMYSQQRQASFHQRKLIMRREARVARMVVDRVI
jgi:hypothetical protein